MNSIFKKPVLLTVFALFASAAAWAGQPLSLAGRWEVSIDFEAGNIKRAPKWMADHGLEWLFRITQDPKRMAKRYLVDDLLIFELAKKWIWSSLILLTLLI